MLERGAGRGQRVGDLRGVQVRPLIDVFTQLSCLGAQRLRGPGGDHPRHDARRCGVVLCLVFLVRLDGRSLLQHGMGVGAADAEGGDADTARPVERRPLHVLREQRDGPGLPVDTGGRLVHVQSAGQQALIEGHDHLDDRGGTGGGLGVADIGLHRAQPQGPVGRAVLAVRGDQRLRLDGIAQLGAGAVCLDHVDLVGRQTGGGQRLADDPLLGGAVGGGEAVAGAVLVDGTAADHGEHPVPVAARVREPFHQQHADALGQRRAVRARREGLDAGVRRQPPLSAELDERGRRGHHGDAPGQRHRAVALPQRVAGQMQGDQRRGAGRVDGDGRALQTEGVRHPAGHHARRVADTEVPLQLGRHLGQPGRVVLVVAADEDAGLAAAQRLRVDAGPLEGLPGGLKQQPLLRVHRQGLAGRDAEERGVEVGGVVQESALPHIGRAGAVRVGVVERLQVPAAVVGERGDRVAALGDDLPEVLRGPDVTRETAAHTDDGDRLVVLGLGLVEPAAGLAQVVDDPLQVVAELVLGHVLGSVGGTGGL